MESDKKEFNHKKASTSDKIAYIGELEHLRRHALRAAASAKENDDIVFYSVVAKEAQTLRRDFMREHFGDVPDASWCLCKSAACLRQIAYELYEGDTGSLKEIDGLVDEVWEHATGEDLSDCEACKEDRAE